MPTDFLEHEQGCMWTAAVSYQPSSLVYLTRPCSISTQSVNTSQFFCIRRCADSMHAWLVEEALARGISMEIPVALSTTVLSLAEHIMRAPSKGWMQHVHFILSLHGLAKSLQPPTARAKSSLACTSMGAETRVQFFVWKLVQPWEEERCLVKAHGSDSRYLKAISMDAKQYPSSPSMYLKSKTCSRARYSEYNCGIFDCTRI